MKRILSLILVFLLLGSAHLCAYAQEELKSGISEYISIEPINADHTDRFLAVNIELDQTYDNAYLFLASYLDGNLVTLNPFDVSEKTSFRFDWDLPIATQIPKQATAIQTTVLVKDPAGNYLADRTPDQIKVFIWDKTTLMPKTLCDNLLTSETIAETNKDVKNLMEACLEATDFVRTKHLFTEEFASQLGIPWPDKELFEIMDIIDGCAKTCNDEINKKLITSSYAQSRYKDEINKIRNLLSKVPQERKDYLTNIISDSTLFGNDEHFDSLLKVKAFLDIPLS